ncbi:SAP domain-containing protein [Lentilactobacillus farraginis]|uniref:SAP domain-containing protein n=1 Tax=Lentilactobacillus farraginis DSM 18382 = JCM 14108 TaxID=1423743 RepID=X0PA40_9LACO|nr:SAP domain-containing protein [Lentilactobacillus farraginis]KRM10901.1 hypothetical protein FD41_GL001928 [Lentilactobacillus farraginis DSM 18382 = JCM 14108]GAF36244.1 hypothetical protein JCM14108_1205 [Lentilactobacillus farraginis DSM 18382 = JCM 14108]
MTQLTKKTFKEAYFYKAELIELCREHGLPTQGTKAELNHYLDCFLSGIPVNQIKPVRKSAKRKALKAADIHLNTPLVDSGFSFNNEARIFFKTYFNVGKFSFTKNMAITKRRAEAKHDLTVTIGDLVRLITNPTPDQLASKTPEEQTYQWNHFVHDFCQSPKSKEFSKKLKVAAILWQHVKHSSGPKQYRNALLKQFAKDIKPYHIKNN